MPVDLISLAVIALVAALSPLVAQAIPGKLVPETVFLLIAGALLGPNLLGAIELTDSVGLLSDLGLAFLFLLAGYEINPKSLTGNQGKRGLFTWIVSIVLAFIVVRAIPSFSSNHIDGIAIAIALTTTALGTLLPILKERGLMGTRVGESILAYGTWGELCPILAMALLLSTRAEWKTVLILLAFAAISIIAAVVPAKAKKAGHHVFRFLTENANTTSQTMMRVTVLLLIGLVALSAVFSLDIVLGAFAAGFVLRYIIPEGDDTLEHKIEGVAYGFLIPVFFVASGAKIDVSAVFTKPVLLVGFIIFLLLIRAVPIYLSLYLDKETRDISSHHRLTVALYCTTALPIIVAVTSVAVKSGAMSQEIASVLVAAGAITVFLMPLLASVTYHIADAKPIEAVKEISHDPKNIGTILRDHVALEHMLSKQDDALKAAARGHAHTTAFIARHLPVGSAPTDAWLPSDALDRALDLIESNNMDPASWEAAKHTGDEAWSIAKHDGDVHWTHLKAEGDKRWSAIKHAGDEVIAAQQEDRDADAATASPLQRERENILAHAVDDGETHIRDYSASEGRTANSNHVSSEERASSHDQAPSEGDPRIHAPEASDAKTEIRDHAALGDDFHRARHDRSLSSIHIDRRERREQRRQERRERLADLVEYEKQRRLAELGRHIDGRPVPHYNASDNQTASTSDISELDNVAGYDNVTDSDNVAGSYNVVEPDNVTESDDVAGSEQPRSGQ